MWLILRKKTVFVNIRPVLLLWTKKCCSKQISIFLWICSLSNLLKKKISDYFWASFWDRFFLLKREFFSEFLPKCFKTTEKHSLAVCGSFWGEKEFLFILSSFTALNKKGCLKQILIYPLDLLHFKLVEKNVLSDYFWASFWDSHFCD